MKAKKKVAPKKDAPKKSKQAASKRCINCGHVAGTSFSSSTKLTAAVAASLQVDDFPVKPSNNDLLRATYSVAEVVTLQRERLITLEEARETLGFSPAFPARGEEHAVAITRTASDGLLHLYKDGKMLYVPKHAMAVKKFEDTGLKITFEPISLTIDDVDHSKPPASEEANITEEFVEDATQKEVDYSMKDEEATD